jgi:hypothetical protein
VSIAKEAELKQRVEQQALKIESKEVELSNLRQ